MEHTRITIDPRIRQGRPCVAGTRIPVHMAQELLASGASIEEIRKDFYSDLTPEDIYACADYKKVTEKHRGVHRSPKRGASAQDSHPVGNV